MSQTMIRTSSTEELERLLRFIEPYLKESWGDKFFYKISVEYKLLLTPEGKRAPERELFYKIEIPTKWLNDQATKDMVEMIKDGACS